ncbi:nimA-like kinase [Arctopsyche grandis]|uniref:nimA-like kinase n=1 Tax=Arctopsyche grandis TaxID=121162 RepID=UPI00406D73E7
MDLNRNHMVNYEKIRTVGKGAFGTAILYRKISVDKLVVLKEIDTADLSPEERLMALNEVEVLSSLNHPNIIGYGGSFIENGVLMIEMEYADGGTLSQMLNSRETHIPEREILDYLRQITSAIAHMHSNNILHRDLKTANVFLNSDGCVKIGDFGISKILSTHVQAQTVLGTPYYISPEMCEGKEYGEKSDIWAMGCILYELCCLHRAFQASSLSALVNKIMQGDYKPVPSGYSKEMCNLITLLLNKNPENRPVAKEVKDIWIPKIISLLGKSGYNYACERNLGKKIVKDRSVLYEMKYWKNESDIQPIQLPAHAKIIDVAIGENHFIAISDDHMVFTWGDGGKGQLGLGELEKYKYHPIPVMSLLNKSIIMAEAGKDFSIFLSSDGKVWSCGDGSFGALGHGDWNNSYEPKIIDFLTSLHIKFIRSSTDHVAAISNDGSLFTWGSGNRGQTGHGITNDSCTPTIVQLSQKHKIQSVFLGYKASMVITTKGKLMACGWNIGNKLCLLKQNNIKKMKQTQCVTALQSVNTIKGRVINCSIGRTHCAIYVKFSNGQTAVYTTGYIKEETNQNILEDATFFNAPIRIIDLNNTEIKTIKCGPTYTIVGTDDNCILFWGILFRLMKGDQSDSPDSQETSGIWSQRSIFNSGPSNQSISLTPATFANLLTTGYFTETIEKPTSILALYASTTQLKNGLYLSLCDIYPLRCNILFLIKTSVPVVSLLNEVKKVDISESASSLDDYDTIGPVNEIEV